MTSSEPKEGRLELFDAHLHLQDPRIGRRVDDVISEAIAGGIRHFACNGCSEADWSEVLDISRRHPEVIPNFGLHPWWVSGRSGDWLQRLRSLLESCPGAGLGECGLHKGKRQGLPALGEQYEVMVEQFRLGRELQRPISVHCVNAFGKLLESVRHEGPFPAGLILHSWSGSRELARQLAREECVFFSISGHSCGLGTGRLEPMLKEIPLDRLLLETDAPDGLPSSGHLTTISPSSDAAGSSPLNHPLNIRTILDVVAEAKDISRAVVAKAAFQNASRLFLRA